MFAVHLARFSPQGLHIAFLFHLVKCYHNVVYGEGKITQTRLCPEAKQVSTRPTLTHCENTFIIHP